MGENMANSQGDDSKALFAENILIVNGENHIFFCGKAIESLLFSSGYLPKKDLLKQITGDNLSDLFKNAINSVRKNQIEYGFELLELGKQFKALPSEINSKWVLIAFADFEKKKNNVDNQLLEREKELKCLSKLNRELKSFENFDKSIENCIKHIIGGFQYPEKTVIRIQLKPHKVYGEASATPSKFPNYLEAPIVINEMLVGRIFVFHKSKDIFLEEKQTLLNEISFIISNSIERHLFLQKLEKRRKILFKKNKKLVELATECGTARKKLQAVLDAITDKLVVIDENYDVIRSNNKSIKNGEKCYKEIFGSYEKCDNCPAENTFNNSEPAMNKFQKGDKYYLVRSYPIFNDDGIVEKVVETCSDITKQKQMENQLFQSYKLASIGKLVAGVGHEINNPNTFIRGNVKIIKESFKDIFPLLDKLYKKNSNLRLARLDYKTFREHIPQLIEDMDHGTDRINNIVLGLRNFAKKNDGLLTDDVDLNTLIENNLRITKKEIMKSAHLRENLDENLPKFKGNSQKIEQVLMNLLVNSSHAIDSINGLISITTQYDSIGQNVILIVEDNGIGMDENTKKYVFDPFFTTKRNRGGTGLGLSILYGIIKEHGGIIDFTSAVGEGTKFTISFPLNKGEK